MKKWSIVVALVVLATIAAAPSFAAKGGQKGKPGAASLAAASTITLDQSDPGLGDAVTFTVSTAVEAKIWVRCWQGAEWIYQKTGSTQAEFYMGSTTWTSGAADCTADLYRDIYQGQTLVEREWLAQTSFHVNG